MSSACSPSEPTMTGASSFVSPSVMMALSVTGSSAARECAEYRSKTNPCAVRNPLPPFVQAPFVGLGHRETALLLDQGRIRARHANVSTEYQEDAERGLGV